jgi:hypothetical protein
LRAQRSNDKRFIGTLPPALHLPRPKLYRLFQIPGNLGQVVADLAGEVAISRFVVLAVLVEPAALLGYLAADGGQARLVSRQLLLDFG